MALRIKETFGLKCDICDQPGPYFGIRLGGAPVSAGSDLSVQEIAERYKKIKKKEDELRALGVEIPAPVHKSYGDYRCPTCKQQPK